MLIVCPGCKTKFTFDDQRVPAEGIKLRCSKCRAMFKVVRKAAAPPVSPAAAAPPGLVAPPVSAAPSVPPSPPSSSVKVVIANESAAFCVAVKKVLAPEPFQVYTYSDGKEAWTAIQELKPDAVLLDVALPSMYGFEVCEAVRRDPSLAGVKLILIASIYDKTRYKRSPQSLYGADDYIEKHHIPDALAPMIYRHLSGQQPVEPEKAAVEEEEAKALPEQLSPQEISAQEESRQELKSAEERETQTQASPLQSQPDLSEGHSKARRLARIIVSDIILYNQGKVEEGVRGGTFFDLMADDISEGRALYERRVAAEIRATTSYLDDAFTELLGRKRQELNL